jgi:hypothetical protein
MMMRRSKSQDDAVMNMCRLYHDDVSSVKMVNFMLPKRRFSFVMAKLVLRSKAGGPPDLESIRMWEASLENAKQNCRKFDSKSQSGYIMMMCLSK